MTVEYTVKDRVATVRLNRPEVFNALDRPTLEAIRDSFRAASADHSVGVVVLTGTGDVLDPENGVMGIGSGGNYALAAARALLDTELSAEQIARKAMAIAATICVYTNDEVVVEALDTTK